MPRRRRGPGQRRLTQKPQPKDIADYKANLIAGGVGGSGNLGQRQYLAERFQRRYGGWAEGLSDYLTWQSQHGAAAAAAQKKTADDAAEFKNNAVADYTTVHSEADGPSAVHRYVEERSFSSQASTSDAVASIWSSLGAWDPLVSQKC